MSLNSQKILVMTTPKQLNKFLIAENLKKNVKA